MLHLDQKHILTDDDKNVKRAKGAKKMCYKNNT